MFVLVPKITGYIFSYTMPGVYIFLFVWGGGRFGQLSSWGKMWFKKGENTYFYPNWIKTYKIAKKITKKRGWLNVEKRMKIFGLQPTPFLCSLQPPSFEFSHLKKLYKMEFIHSWKIINFVYIDRGMCPVTQCQ